MNKIDKIILTTTFCVLALSLLVSCELLPQPPAPSAMTVRSAIYDPARDGQTTATLRAEAVTRLESGTAPGFRYAPQGNLVAKHRLSVTATTATVDNDSATTNTTKMTLGSKLMTLGGTIAGYIYGKK
jgi:hypothetical protein